MRFFYLFFIIIFSSNLFSKQSNFKFSNTTDQIIIKFRKKIDKEILSKKIFSLKKSMNLKFQREFQDKYILKLDGRKTEEEINLIINELKKEFDIEYAEPDKIAYPALEPNDPYYISYQWHYKSSDIGAINLPPAWDITVGSRSTVVAVLDTGILPHQDISSSRILGGYDMISDPSMGNDGDGRDNDPSDAGDWNDENPSSWHGLHVTGTIGATSNNSTGVSGIDWNCRILPVRVLGKGGGYSSDLADAIIWASGGSVNGVPNNSNPAKVINMSLGGGDSCPNSVQNAINYAVLRGISVIVAAGNNNSDASGFWPCNCSGVMCVAAVDRDGNKADYSNYGSNVFISACGGSSSGWIWSTLNTGTTTPIPSPSGDTYDGYAGTSMATPHVSGVVSLMVGFKPSLTLDEIRYNLRKTAKPFPANSTCNTNICGAGIIDAYNALNNLVISISSSTPSYGLNTGNVNLSVWGKGFINGANVKLKRNGYSDVICQNVNVINLNQINCILPLNGVSPGKWNLVVENTDNSSYTLTNYFEVDTLSVGNILPDKGFNDSNVNVSISGSGFMEPFYVKLTKNGYKDIISYNNNFISSTSVSCSFSLSGEFSGKRDLVFINGDGSIFKVVDGFEILNATLSVASISPSSGYNDNNSLNVMVYGSGFTKDNMSAKLIKEGYTDITCTPLSVITSTSALCYLNLYGEFDGKRDFFILSQSGNLTKTDFFEILNSTPLIYSVYPFSVCNNNSSQEFNIYGKGFRKQSYVIKLYKAGYSDIVSTSYDVKTSTYIKSVFNIYLAMGGKRNISVGSLYKSDAVEITDCSLPPYVSWIDPSYSYNDKDPIINIFGGNFTSGLSIKVIKDEVQLDGTDFTLFSSTAIISCRLPLKGKEAGIWTIRVINPSGKYGDFSGFNLLKFEENIKVISPLIDKNNSSVKIKYKIENPQSVSIKVYDKMGRFIKTLYRGYSDKGINEINWDGTDESARKVKSGIYVIEIKTNSYTEYKRIVVVR